MGRGLRAKYLIPFCLIRDSLQFDMQHCHVLKKIKFDLLTPLCPPPGSDPGLRSCLRCFIFIVPLSAPEVSVKTIDN